MSVEARLRKGLASNAEAFDPQVERRLALVVVRRRRRRLLRRGLVVVAACSLLTVAAVVVPKLLGGDSGPVRVEVRAPAESAVGQVLTGRYATTVLAATGVVSNASLAGRWTLTLKADGTLALQTPAAYNGVLSGALFTSTPSVFRSSVFDQDLCSGLGVASYRWTRSGSTLKFTVADDRCPGRLAIFTSATWNRIP